MNFPAARAAAPQVGDRYEKEPSEYRTMFDDVRFHPAKSLVVEAVDKEWVTVNSDGYRTKLLLAQWPKLALTTIEHGAKFFPAKAGQPAS